MEKMPFMDRKYEILSLDIDASNPPLEILIVALLTQSDEVHTKIVWHKGPLYFFGRFNRAILNSKDETALATDILEISRFYAREIDTGLYGEFWRRRVEVDQWIVLCISKEITTQEQLKSLNGVLLVQTYLVGSQLTLADIFVFSSLQEIDMVEFQKYSNLTRWFKFIQSFPAVQNALFLIKEHKVTDVNPRRLPQQGKFADLPNAKPGKLVVRFPPEASGYLHIGHAKAALLNQYYAELYNGQLVMRFDDTNPAKETVEFEEAILQDLELLKIKPDRFTHTSDYFDKLEQYCTTLIKDGKAYVDDTPPELMKVKRDEKLKPENRDNPVEINLKLWEEMRRGSDIGQRCCVRAMIDYESKNGCLRDPTIYRCKSETHPRTGNKYKVYPTYDFACPLVDFIENVTHPLRTTEYEDRDDQYNWILQQFTQTLPCIVSYSRLNMTHTVLSKRKLTWFVDQGLVDGWDDPRMPTIRGILRHGMTVEALKDFIIAQGSSRSVVVMEWDKIWAFNKKVIDPVAVRYTALKHETVVKVNVIDAKKEFLTVQNHPKDPTKGTKQVLVGPKLLIEREDAECLVVDQNATFINWGNLMILKINRDDNNTITSVDARLNLEDKNYKNTLKITWLNESEDEKTNPILCYAVYFDHLLSVPTLPKDGDFKFFVNTSTRKEDLMLGEIELQRVKKGEIIQLQRKGFFICDVPYASASSYSSREQPLILFHIPDGHATTAQKTQKPQEQIDEKKKIDKVKKLKNKEPEVLIQEQVTSIPKSKESNLNSKSFLSTIAQLAQDIKEQINKVNDLRNRLEDEVRVLANQQYEYKQLIGYEWFDHVTEVKNKVGKIVEEIHKQSEKVQNLKSSKADKSVIDEEEKILFNLERDYGDVTGVSYAFWKRYNTTDGDKKMEIKGNTSKPVGATVASDTKTESKEEALKAEKIAEEIQKQGDKIRSLKSSKADKSVIVEEVKILLSLKSDYKDATGQDWKPGQTTGGDKKTEIMGKTSKPVGATVASDTKTESKEEALKAEKIAEEIQKQGDKVRSLKSSKADKSIIDEEVKILLSLKNDYKDATGQDWKPGQTTGGDKKTEIKGKTSKPVGATVASDTKTESKEEALKAEKIAEEIQKQGDKVRSLKSSKADKSTIDEEVKILLSLKSDYKNATGQDWKPGQTAAVGIDKKTKIKEKTSKPAETTVSNNVSDSPKSDSSKKTRLGLEVKKEENFFEWYSQVITKAGMIEYYDVSGCYILRPWSFEIWKQIRKHIDQYLSVQNVQECYFPMFVTRDALEREKTHIADFAPEVAWVTKCGNSEMAEPVAIRPTSETIMYPAYAKWLRSDTELPLRLNQWNNVVRWEFKDPKPFIRSREFLWQEGHSAFATKAEAEIEVLSVLDMYAFVYEKMLCVPVVKGRKTEKEKFAGGEYTTTVEAFIPTSGRAIQGATSHHLGQNFSKMFNIQVEGIEGGNEKTFVYQNSWGLTTRTIGVMVMVHGDDKGLVLPPRVAPVQAIIIPCGITAKTTPEDRDKIYKACHDTFNIFRSVTGNIYRVKCDFRDNRTVGWKYCDWELRGVPVRIEIGPKEIANNELVFVRRDTFESQTIKADSNSVISNLSLLFESIEGNMYRRAKTKLDECTKLVENWDDFITEFNKKNLLLAPFCGEPQCEDNIKADSATMNATNDEPGTLSMGAKGLCIPFEQPESATPLDELNCVHKLCEKKPKYFTLFGRSY